MLMWPGKSSKWIIARKKKTPLSYYEVWWWRQQQQQKWNQSLRRCHRFACHSVIVYSKILFMDDRQEPCHTKVQRFFSNNTSHDKIDAPLFGLIQFDNFFGGFKSIAKCFSQKKALGWKLQDIETHDITGKKHRSRVVVVVASRSWEILFRLTSSTLSHAMFRPWWPRLESARDLLAVLDGVNWKKSSSLWIQLELGWAPS